MVTSLIKRARYLPPQGLRQVQGLWPPRGLLCIGADAAAAAAAAVAAAVAATALAPTGTPFTATGTGTPLTTMGCEEFWVQTTAGAEGDAAVKFAGDVGTHEDGDGDIACTAEVQPVARAPSCTDARSPAGPLSTACVGLQ